MTIHSNPLNSREVCLQLRHFNQVIGQQCRNMARQNHLPMLPDGHCHRLRRRYQTVRATVSQTQPANPVIPADSQLAARSARRSERVRRIETLNRTNNEISWLLRELYFETF